MAMSLKSPDEIIYTAPNTPQVYTQFHLGAVAFSHPPTPWSIKQCTCEGKSLQDKPAKQNQHVRIYYAEPSYYDYTHGSFLIKENRFTDAQGWHAPSDGLVADDAVAGSPVAVIGWWHSSEDGLSFEDRWETRIYYVDRNGNIRERINCSYFDPASWDDFDLELPKPEELIPLIPGWKLTPLGDGKSAETVYSFPVINPLPVTKLAAIRTDAGEIYLFYQASDLTIKVLVSAPDKGWVQQETEAVGSGQVRPGTSLAAVAGGWSEIRLFYVTPQNNLGEVYKCDGVQWTQSKLPSYTVIPIAMLAAVAWNYATPFFQIRVYVTGGEDEIQEYSFSRNTGSWSPARQPDNSGSKADGLSTAIYPVSAVAAVMVGDGCSTKVYFHPRRFVVEWESCTRASFPSTITTVSERFKARREIEKETRVKIAGYEEQKQREEEERLRKEEEERKRREEEEKLQREEEERKRQEEERRQQEEEERRIDERKRLEEESRRNNLPVLSVKDLQFKEMLKGKQVGDRVQIPKGAVIEKIRKMTGCQAGYEWEKHGDGWRCAGGAHHLTNEQFNAL
ncbi:hypothetical protein F4803DRAFT_125541 [Xylaria telfairii]|nr:hypothetical protein F4803DRAFT_125541 [Xylaria telfairii]